MSLEQSIDKLTAAIEKNNALLASQAKSSGASAPAETTTTSAKAEKPETAAQKKKRLAAEKKAAEAAKGPADLAEFKSALLGQVEGRPDAAQFTKEFMSVNGYAAAAEIPEEEWAEMVEKFAQYITEKASAGDDI